MSLEGMILTLKSWTKNRDEVFKEPSHPLYTSAPPRQWVGLTDEDMAEPRTHNFDFIDGARWAEAKLRERNT